MKKEEELLRSVLWPESKVNLLGNLSYSSLIDFKDMIAVDVSRKNDKIEMFYCSAPLENIKEKTYFVKLYFKKGEDGYDVDFDKTSPELKTEEDINNTLNVVRNAIIKMNAKPNFFPTGVVEGKKLKNEM